MVERPPTHQKFNHREQAWHRGAELKVATKVEAQPLVKSELDSVLPSEEIQKPSEVCVHHWMIESPNGHFSMAICKNCSSIREFSNSAPTVQWETNNYLASGYSRATRTTRQESIRLSDELA